MARAKFDALHARILEDIKESFSPGDRYRTLRGIAEDFKASQQTVQFVVRSLCEEGILLSVEKRGLYVQRLPGSVELRGKTILVSSSMFDPRFTNAFLSSITSVAAGLGLKVVDIHDEDKDANTLQHGDRLIELYREHDASGLIALAYRNVELAFYHALNAGCRIISDVCFPNLPILPAVQPDNHLHSAEAARTFAKLGKKEMLVAGYWKKGNVRQISFEEEFKRLVKGGSVKYVYLGDETSPADIYLFLRRFESRYGIFSTDYAANHTLAAYLSSYGISPKNNFMVFDSESAVFRHPGLGDVCAAAPGLDALGRRLAERLIGCIEKGAWSEPLQELL